jgi:uncharacterized membrane protein
MGYTTEDEEQPRHSGARVQAAPIQVQPKFDPYTGAPIGCASDVSSHDIEKVENKALTSMILGIVGIVVLLLGIIFGPIAIALGLSAKKTIKEHPEQFKHEAKAQANAGFILGIIDTILSVIVIILIAVFVAASRRYYYDYYYVY